MIFAIIAGCVAFCALIALIIFGIICVKGITAPHVYDREHELAVLPDWGYDVRPFLDSVENTPFEYTVSAGYTLRGSIIPARGDAVFADGHPRAVLLVHGHTCNRYTMLSYGEIYHRLGFSLVIYDQRYHGESGGDFASMGLYEARDALEIAQYARTLFPEDTVWGIHGESMGAATVMMAAPGLDWMKFVCEDCGYTTLKEEIPASIKYKTGLPRQPFGAVACLIVSLWRGFDINKVRPIDCVAKIQVPMLFAHGGDDRFVPTEMVYRLYAAKPGDNKKLKIFDGMPHAKSILSRHEEYYELLRDFLTEYNIV